MSKQTERRYRIKREKRKRRNRASTMHIPNKKSQSISASIHLSAQLNDDNDDDEHSISALSVNNQTPNALDSDGRIINKTQSLPISHRKTKS